MIVLLVQTKITSHFMTSSCRKPAHFKRYFQISKSFGFSKKPAGSGCCCSSVLPRPIEGVHKYIFYDLRDTSASLESLICPSAEPRLCITPREEDESFSLPLCGLIKINGSYSQRFTYCRGAECVECLCTWM